jgi:uncharacterized protein YigA (DUF484 family)
MLGRSHNACQIAAFRLAQRCLFAQCTLITGSNSRDGPSRTRLFAPRKYSHRVNLRVFSKRWRETGVENATTREW